MFEADPLYETTEEWGWDEPVCGYCNGDGGDPMSDYILPCPECGIPDSNPTKGD